MEHNHDAAFHIGDAGAVDGFIIQHFAVLEAVFNGKDRVHMAGEHHFDRGVDAFAEAQGLSQRHINHAAILADALHRREVKAFAAIGFKRGEFLFDNGGHRRQAIKIIAAGIDIRPGQRHLQHGVLLACNPVQMRLIGG